MSDDTGAKDAIRQRMTELGRLFVDRTAREAKQMREFFERARGGDAQAVGDMRHLAHKIFGTGCTLGFESLGGRAGELERLADQSAGRAPDAHLAAQMEESLKRFEQELDQLLR